VRESCLNCHTPHGSNHFKLQKTSVPYICQQCHSNTRHPGTLYDARGLATSLTPSSREFARACLNCHAAIHGTNHPSAPYLGH
jgi:predicted CXXCH cytochrome family protein